MAGWLPRWLAGWLAFVLNTVSGLRDIPVSSRNFAPDFSLSWGAAATPTSEAISVAFGNKIGGYS